MRSPYSPWPLLAFVLTIGLLLAFVQVGVLTIAFEKLGLSQNSAFLLLFGSLLGSAVNIPVATIRADRGPADLSRPSWPRVLLPNPRYFSGTTLIAVNVGGALIPVGFSAYLAQLHALHLATVAPAVAIVALVSYVTSRPVPGFGIAMPILVAPLTAGATALLLDPQASPPLAYVCGTLGVLLGADLMHFPEIRRLGAPIASIGGAGTFDGIFITGIVAVLLA
jgi:uncharacterized membrane protein